MQIATIHLLFLVGVLCSLTLAKRNEFVDFVAGWKYVYNYEASIQATEPLSEGLTGLKLVCKVAFIPIGQGQVFLQLHDILQRNLTDDDVMLAEVPENNYGEHLKKPIRFSYIRGRVLVLVAESTDPEWSLNIKKGVLTLLNVLTEEPDTAQMMEFNVPKPKKEKKTNFHTYETGIGGKCATQYDIKYVRTARNYGDQHSGLNITKFRNLNDCKPRPFFKHHTYDTDGCQNDASTSDSKYGDPLTKEKFCSSCKTDCECQKFQDRLRSCSYTKYNISTGITPFRIDEISNEAFVIYSIERKFEIVVNMSQQLQLRGIDTNRPEIPVITSPFLHRKLEIEMNTDFPYGLNMRQSRGLRSSEADETLVQHTRTHLSELTKNVMLEDHKLSEMISDQAVRLIRILSEFTKQELEELLESVSNLEDPKAWIMRKLLLDAISLCGSNEAAQFVKTAFKADLITKSEAAEMISVIPRNIFRPSEETLEDYLDLCRGQQSTSDTSLLSTVCLAFAKLVKERCKTKEDPQSDSPDTEELSGRLKYLAMRRSIEFQKAMKRFAYDNSRRFRPYRPNNNRLGCSENAIKKYIKVIWTMFQEEKTFAKKMVLVRALLNMGVEEVIPLLTEIITSDRQDCAGFNVTCDPQQQHFLRTTVVYFIHGLARQFPKKILPLMASVYFNRAEPSQLRIAAMTVILESNPPISMFQRIVTDLYHEESLQVKSFVLSALKYYPLNSGFWSRETIEKIRSVLETAPEMDFGIQYSIQFSSGDYYLRGTKGNIVWDGHSILPQAAYFALKQTVGGLGKILGYIGFSARGMDDVVEAIPEIAWIYKMLKPSKLSKEETETSSYSNVTESTEKLPIIPRTFGEPSIVLDWNIFNQNGFYALDKDDLLRFTNNIRPKPQNVSFNYVKLFLPSKLSARVPSELGLPIEVFQMSPVIVYLQAKNMNVSIEKATRPNSPPIVFNISASIKASLHYSFSYAMSIISGADGLRYGASLTGFYPFLLSPSNISLGNKPENGIFFSIHSEEPIIHSSLFRTQPYNTSVFVTKSGEKIAILQEKPVAFRRNEEPFVSNFERRKRSLFEFDDYNAKSFEYPELLKSAFRIGKPRVVFVNADRHISWIVREAIHSSIFKKQLLLMYFSLPFGAFPSGIEFHYNSNYAYHDAQTEVKEGMSSSDDDFFMTFKDTADEDSGKNNVDLDLLSQSDKHYKGDQISEKTSMEKVGIPKTPSSMAHTFLFRLILPDVTEKDKVKGFADFSVNITINESLDKHVHDFYIDVNLRPENLKPLCPTRSYVNGTISFNTLLADLQYVPLSPTAEYRLLLEGVSRCDYIRERGEFSGTLYRSDETHDMSFCDPLPESIDEYMIPPPWYICQCRQDNLAGKSQSYACQLAMAHALTFTDLKAHEKFIIGPLEPDEKFTSQETDIKFGNSSFSHLEESENTTVENDFEMSIGRALQPLVKFHSGPQYFLSQAYNYKYPAYCAVMENFIMTFDNVTYLFPKSTCHYLLTKECSTRPHFAIFVTGSTWDQAYRDLAIVIPDRKIELKIPSKGERVQVIVDDKDVTPQPRSSTVFCNIEGDECIVINLLKPPQVDIAEAIVVDIRYLGLQVQYDGKNVRVQVSYAYQGRLCGLCSNFDSEMFNEFEGPQKCIYSEAQDFLNSYVINPEICGISPKIAGEMICPTYPMSNSTEEVQKSCLIKRTVYIETGDYTCFSTQPVNSCHSSCIQKAVRNRKVQYHCLKSGDPFTESTKKLSEHQVITDFANQRVDFVTSISEPISCEKLESTA